MKTFTNFGDTLVKNILDFMDKAPLVIPSVLTVVIVTGYWFLG